MLSVQKPVSRKEPHYPISNLFLIVLLYIVEAKKGCKKKSLNILSLAADLLKSNKLCHVLCHMSLVMRKPDFRISENKDADQLNREADQRLCFRYT